MHDPRAKLPYTLNEASRAHGRRQMPAQCAADDAKRGQLQCEGGLGYSSLWLAGNAHIVVGRAQVAHEGYDVVGETARRRRGHQQHSNTRTYGIGL
jgi:hypothetical protein